MKCVNIYIIYILYNIHIYICILMDYVSNFLIEIQNKTHVYVDKNKQMHIIYFSDEESDNELDLPFDNLKPVVLSLRNTKQKII